MTATDKEPWNYEAFVALYDEIARSHPGGCPFNRGGSYTPEVLQQLYEYNTTVKTLREFADGQFRYEQFAP